MRSDEKCTGYVAYPYFEWKVFSAIKVSSTDRYISGVMTPGTELSI